ncbi:hypothetical protein JW752_05445 [Candidatus Peregrinibacteria bacterium]|nr:hypothetical protein [Candidatus Peregrinibacteria bacterium]
MFFKLIADTFSVARDSDHFIQLKTLKKPNTDDQVWLAIEIVGDSKYARSTAQSIMETVEEVYFDQFELSPYERFEQALKEVNLIVNNLREKRKKSFGKINAIMAVFSGQELHLTQAGDSEAYLIRNNKFSMISEGLNSKSKDLFVNIASGELTTDDKLIFSTGRLLRLATHSQIVQLFTDGVAEAIESTRELTMNDEELSIGVICMHIKLLQKGSSDSADRSPNPVWLSVKKFFGAAANFLTEKAGRKTHISKRNVLLALAAIMIILVVSVSFLMNSRRDNAIREEYRTRIEQLNQDLHVANTKGYANDKETANAILEKVEKESREILDSGYFRAETLALLDKIQAARDSINNTDRLKELVPYIDLSAKGDNVKALGIMSLNSNFFIYEYNRLYEVILDQVLDPRQIDDTEVVIAGTAMEDQDALVFLTQSGRVMEYADGLIHFANTDDQAWKSGVDVAAYGKYIYVLNPTENQIYKYSRLRNKYSARTDYNGDADLSGGISMTIDGDIYVLKDGGRIVRIYKSKQQPFKIEDLAVDISASTQIFTRPEIDNLYLLDPTNKRVVILTKSDSGNSRYYGQVVFEELNNIRQIYVEANENFLYVLTDKEVYKVEI